MEKDEFAAPNEDRWLDVAVAIADGTPIDWSATSADPSAPVGDGGLWMVRLQCLERLVRGHDAMRTSTSEAGDAPALDTFLTEARRAAPASDTPLHVHWGPLIVVEKIGRGSFGDVYRAWDPRLDREVALKLIPESASESAGSPVVEEGRLLARVRHPNVLTVHGAERIDGRVGIWTEYLRGETLAAEVARRGSLPADEAARIGIDVCRALGAVHEAGLLHRDVKAQNIMRDATGRLVLGDFGTGVEFDEHAAVAEPQIAGTPLYLAPEIFDHGPATIGTDLYSVGVLLYFLVTGNYPVRGRTFADIRGAHAVGARVPLREARPELSGAFADVVEALLAVEPDRRYGSADAVERALEAWLAEPPDTGRRAPRATHPWLSGWRAAVAIVGSIALAAAVASMVWHLASHTRADAPQATAGVTQAPLPFNAGDWVVVADIENRTGEDVLDGAIEAAVKRELEFSDHVRVAQRGRVEDALRSLSRPVTARLDRQLARDVSLRDSGVRALIAGSVTKAEGAYTMTLDIVNPTDGATISTLTDRAPQRSDILTAVRRQTLRVRAALGEPAASIDHSHQVLEQSPLPTLKAFALYAQARTIMSSMSSDRAASAAGNPVRSSGASIPIDRLLTAERMMRDAVEDDPTFARAHLQLAMANVGLALQNLGDRRDAIKRSTERAFELAATATPQERYRIIATTHHHRAGDNKLPPGPEDPRELQRAASAFEAVFALQPDDDDVMVLLQNCYRTLGRARDAAWMDLRLADARPLNVVVNFRVATGLLREGNFDGARRYALRAQTALSPETAAVQPQQALSIRLFRALAAWLQDDARETLRSIDQVAATADHSSSSDRREVGLNLWPIYVALGRIDQARRLLDATRLIEGSDVEKQRVEVSRASFFDVIGDRRALHEVVAAWPDPFPEDAQGGGELASLIETGKFEAAERELQRWDRFSKNFGRPGEVIHLNFAGAIELARGRHAAAIDLLQNSMGTMRLAPADRGWSLSGQGQWAAPKLAEALEKAHRLPEAIAILEEAGARRSEVAVGPSYGIALWMRHRSQLARLYRKNGQTREAEAVEAHLLKLLAVADPDHPLLLEPRARR